VQYPTAKIQSLEDYLQNFQTSDEDLWPVDQATSKGIVKVDGVGEMNIVDWKKDRIRPGSRDISRFIKLVGLELKESLGLKEANRKIPHKSSTSLSPPC